MLGSRQGRRNQAALAKPGCCCLWMTCLLVGPRPEASIKYGRVKVLRDLEGDEKGCQAHGSWCTQYLTCSYRLNDPRALGIHGQPESFFRCFKPGSWSKICRRRGGESHKAHGCTILSSCLIRSGTILCRGCLGWNVVSSVVHQSVSELQRRRCDDPRSN